MSTTTWQSVKAVLHKYVILVVVYKIKDNLTGQSQFNITIGKRVPKPNHLKMNGSYWQYMCKCGNSGIAHRTTIIRGLQSCGCIGKQKLHKTKSTKHYRRLYHVWHAMKKRCYRKKDRDYSSYGGRGICISDNWMEFANFYNDMIDTYEPGLSVERIDVDDNYCVSNCIWIPLRAQAKNRRSSLAYRLSTGYQWPHAK